MGEGGKSFALSGIQIAEGTVCLQFLCLGSHHPSLRKWLGRDNISQCNKPVAGFCILLFYRQLLGKLSLKLQAVL